MILQIEELLRLVDNLAHSFYLAEEGEMRGGLVLPHSEAQRLYGGVTATTTWREHHDALELVKSSKVIGDNGKVNVTPFIGATTGIGAV